MTITDESYERAKAAIAGLKAAGGFDLTGFEHLWADITPELAIAAMLDGEIWVSVGGKWVSFGVARSLTIENDIDQVDVSFIGGPRQQLAGLSRTTLHAELDFTNEAWEWLRTHDHDKFDIRVSAGGRVIETSAVMQRSQTEFGGKIGKIYLEADVIGPQVVHLR